MVTVQRLSCHGETPKLEVLLSLRKSPKHALLTELTRCYERAEEGSWGRGRQKASPFVFLLPSTSLHLMGCLLLKPAGRGSKGSLQLCGSFGGENRWTCLSPWAGRSPRCRLQTAKAKAKAMRVAGARKNGTHRHV